MQQTAGKRVRAVMVATAVIGACFGAAAGPAMAKKPPKLKRPAHGTTVNQVPAFAWKAVRGAAKYEFQLAADRQFESIVLGQGRGTFQTRNTFATIEQTLANGDYFWRVRSINRRDNAGRWSRPRTLHKKWNDAPELIHPVRGEQISYPHAPLVLRWNPVPGAYKYLVWIGTDPSLASVDRPIETSGTVFSPNEALGAGRYYWAVTPIDSQKHMGVRSSVGSFVWTWPSGTTTKVFDLNSNSRVFDPQFSWDPVAGAARYEVEINPSADFAVGSKVCCSENVIGTSLSPKDVLPNNSYYWRVRAVDLDGQAGAWNQGTPFAKTFDAVSPSIPNLHMRTNVTDSPADEDPATPTVDLSHPIVRWDPVAGAASYHVQVVPYESSVCNWTSPGSEKWDVTTATTAWTPLASAWNNQTPGLATRTVSFDTFRALQDGNSYCVRVRAQSDRDVKGSPVVSAWTQLGGSNKPAFKWKDPGVPGGSGAPLATATSSTYREPQHGSVTGRMPLFTWNPVQGAGSYFVVVAKDPSFTQVLDVALTNLPMYAPRKGMLPQTYPDETTSYYWAVVPARDANGNNANTEPNQNSPRFFQKRSTPPTLVTPGNGEDVLRQVVFRWTSTEAAREYNLQVSTDPSFSNLLDDVKTSGTSYTSEKTYPADTVLYWRVRASDENLVGLTWSRIGTFRRRLPKPTLGADNPTAGDTIPVLRWNPVEGATSYDMHVVQADGTRRDFHLRGTAFTASTFYGTGVWHWQVRANFPGGGFREVQGGYTGASPFTRHIATPARARAVNRNRRMLLRWSPVTMAKNYRLEISRTDSFTQVIDRATTDHTEWAPKLTSREFLLGGKFYWRVAAVDEGNNVGGWRTAKLKTKRALEVRASGFSRKRTKTVIQVAVTRGTGRPVRKAKVVAKGAGMKRRKGRTNRKGIARIKVRPKKRGALKFRVKKRGFWPAATKVPVL